MSFENLNTDILLYSCQFLDAKSIVMLLETCKRILNICRDINFENIFRSKFNSDHLDITDFSLNELLLYAKSYLKKNMMSIVHNKLYIIIPAYVHNVDLNNQQYGKYKNNLSIKQLVLIDNQAKSILEERYYYHHYVRGNYIYLTIDGIVKMGNISNNVDEINLCEKIINITDNFFTDRRGNCFIIEKQKYDENTASLLLDDDGSIKAISIDMTKINNKKINKKTIGKNIIQRTSNLTLDHNGWLSKRDYYNKLIPLENVIQITDNNFILLANGEIFKTNGSGDLRKMNINLGKIKQISPCNTFIQLIILTEDGSVFYYGKELTQDLYLKHIEEILVHDSILYALDIFLVLHVIDVTNKAVKYTKSLQ